MCQSDWRQILNHVPPKHDAGPGKSWNMFTPVEVEHALNVCLWSLAAKLIRLRMCVCRLMLTESRSLSTGFVPGFMSLC